MSGAVFNALCTPAPRPSEEHQRAGTVLTPTPQVRKRQGVSETRSQGHGRRGLKPKLQPWPGLPLDPNAAAEFHLGSPDLLGFSCCQTQPCSRPAVEASLMEALKYSIPSRDLGTPLCGETISSCPEAALGVGATHFSSPPLWRSLHGKCAARTYFWARMSFPHLSGRQLQGAGIVEQTGTSTNREMWKITAMEPPHGTRVSSPASLLHRPVGLQGLVECTGPTGTPVQGERGGRQVEPGAVLGRGCGRPIWSVWELCKNNDS